MWQFLKSFSINTLGFAAIVAALMVIVVNDPPKTFCDAETENFKKGVIGFLYPDPKAPNIKPSYFDDRDNCRARNSPGACVGLFVGLNKMLDVSSAVSEKCLGKLGEVPAFFGALTKSLDLMIRLAWGTAAPPASPALKNGWLNPSDVYLFCRLKNKAVLIYGEQRFNEFREQFFTDLPGAKGMTREQFWEKSLLSTNCDSL